MVDEPIFTTGALDLIRTMATEGQNINKIRAALFTSEHVWFRDADIIAAGATFDIVIEKVDHNGQAYDRGAVLLMPERRGPPPDKIRHVAPGTHKIPVGGYRMGASHV